MCEPGTCEDCCSTDEWIVPSGLTSPDSAVGSHITCGVCGERPDSLLGHVGCGASAPDHLHIERASCDREGLIRARDAEVAAEALRGAAEGLAAATEGEGRVGTSTWRSETARDAYSLAVEESVAALHARADRIEREGEAR